MRQTNYTLQQIKKNILAFNKKITYKNLNTNFWIIVDRSDFKPLKKNIIKNTEINIIKNTEINSKKNSKKNSKVNSKKNSKVNNAKSTQSILHSIKEIRDNILDEKGEYYKDKKFADIKINISQDILDKLESINEYKNLKNKVLISVHIIVYLIDSDGHLNISDKWELKVRYYIDDFRTVNFKLKNIEVIMRLAADSVVTTKGINGISYSELLDKINKNNSKDNKNLERCVF